MRNLLLICAIIAVVLTGTWLSANAAEDLVVTGQATVSVEINKGKLIKLDGHIASVAIADPNVADVQVVSPKLLFLRGKKIGETSIYAVDSADNAVFSAVLEVTHNISKLEAEVKRVAPDAEVNFKSVDGGLVMEGFAPNVTDAENINKVASAFLVEGDRLVNMIKTGGSDQVALKVRFVEMQRSDLKSIGVNLQNVTANGSFAWQLLQGKDILFHTADPDVFAYSTPGSVLLRPENSVASNLYLRYKDANALVDALETNGLARVLAEPTLTTTTGSAASFLAGGQFPLPVLGSQNTVTIQYQPFGVGLNFTPIVMNKNRISLTVAPEVSTLNFNNPLQIQDVTYPILNTRRASAVVELGSGDTFMLAGLLQSESSQTINKFPGIGDLPVIGSLFRSQSFQNNQTELVILVTPYIVRPVSDPQKLQTPADGYVPPNDLQRLMLGNIYQQEPLEKEGQSTMPSLQGSGGFILGE